MLLEERFFFLTMENTRIFLFPPHGHISIMYNVCVRFLGHLKKNLPQICLLKTPMETLSLLEAGSLKLMFLTSSEPAHFSTMTILNEGQGEGQSLIQITLTQ
jgi:hypothetical protein